mgnify:CR=1 FL=1
MNSEDVGVQKTRSAIEDRALYLALLYRSFATALPAGEAERLAREAIYEYGRIKGERDGRRITAEEWVRGHVAKGSAAVFESRIVEGEDCCEQQMTYCPLIEAWRKLGCSQDEIDLLCDLSLIHI